MLLQKSHFSFFLLFFTQIFFAQNDCVDAIVACGNSNFSGLSVTDFGIQELNGSNNCSSAENNSIWLKVNIQTTGTLAFTLTPESTNINEDFDFFIFGPLASCANLGTAIRCSTTNPMAAGQGNNLTGLSSSESDTSEGPGQNGNSFVSAINALAGETYYIVIDRPVGNSNFSLQWTGTATFSPPPTVNNNTTSGSTLNIEKCDTDNFQDNITNFDLTTNTNLAIGNQPNVVASYHLSVNDAVTNSAAIVNPESFRNSTNPQEIHIRLTNTITGCFATDQFTINVIPFVTNDPQNIEECDLDNDGFAVFNLTQNTANLVANDPNLSVTYHPFVGSTTILPNNYTNQTAFFNETVWAKISDTNQCYSYKPFDLIVNAIPTATPSQLTQCDFELNPDGLTTFNLNEAIPQLTGNATNVSVKFYYNTNDALTDTNETNSNFRNIVNPQTIGVRVINNTTGCYAVTSLILNTTVNPTQTIPLANCDDNDQLLGFTTFDLTEAGLETGGNTVSYYLNPTDALLEQNAQNAIFTNTAANHQQIYARVENGNNCIGIHILDLTVKPLPNIETQDLEIFCLNTPGAPARLDSGIGTANPNDFLYFWTPDGQTTPTIDVFAAGTYTVTVTNALNCSQTRTVIVKESDLAVVEDVAIIDLTDNNSATVFVQDNIQDYTYSLDLPNGPFQESNHFENLLPGIHHLYLNDKDGCGILKYEISILDVPNFFTPNGDGVNDTWKITGMENGHYQNTQIYIFNRYGKLLKQITAAGEGWNGLFNGEQVPASDYWYMMQLEDGRTIKGHFSLKR